MSYPLFKKTAAILLVGALLFGAGGAVVQAESVDTTGPSVAPVTPLTATAGVALTLNSSFTEDISGISYCYVIINGVGLSSDMTRSGSSFSGNLSQVHTFSSAGSYAVAVRCYDLAGNAGQSGAATVVVSAATPADTTPPTVNTPVVSSVGVGTPITFSATYSDASNVSTCRFYLNGELQSTMAGTGNSGTVSYTRTFSSPGSHTYYTSCTDERGNVGVSATRSLTVTGSSVDGVAPMVGPLNPGTAVVGSLVTFTATYADAVGVVACEFDPGTASTYAATLSGSLTSGTASRSFTFTSPGVRSVYMRCSDAAGNVGTATQSVHVVSSVVTDVTAPVVGSVSPTNIATGQSVTLTANYTDAVGVVSCRLYVNGNLAWTSGTLLSPATNDRVQLIYSFSSPGTYYARYECQDAAGNNGIGPNTTLYVSGGGSSYDPVSVGQIAPVTVTAGVNTNVSAWVSNTGYNVASCDLYVNGSNAGGMIIAGNAVSRYYTFPYAGNYSVYARCYDRSGNGMNGQVVTVQAISQGTNPGTPGAATMGSLMKAMCPNYYVNSDHPCRAVYYFGRDGRRHAFPNANVYFTWYSDFSRVIEVSDSFLASIPLGRNVTYRPGIRLVKFTTLNRVYAVGRGGVLRWITSEEVARQLYGYNWAAQVDDIADVFYTNYTFGSDIYAASQYNPGTEASFAPTIDDNF